MIFGLGGGAFTGDAGLLNIGFVGDAGRWRGTTVRVFEDVGDRTCAGWIDAASFAGTARTFFLAFSTAVPWFSLSAPEISSLGNVS